MPRNYKRKTDNPKMGRPTEWTLERALELGESLIAWLLESKENVYWERFIVIERQLYPEITADLSSKYAEFAQLLKRARKIQEIRLLETVGKGEIKSMFVLKNHHGYTDKQEIKTENLNYNYDPGDLRAKTTDELLELLNAETNTSH